MKTKLTLNIEETIIKKMKTVSKKRKQSISSIVEDYFKENFPAPLPAKKKKAGEETFTERFRRMFPPPENITSTDYKAEWHKHLDEKYGK